MTEAIIKVAKENALATNAAKAIDSLIEKLLVAETQIEHGYARLGFLLKEVSEEKHWKSLGFDSFGKYMMNLSAKFNKGRSQLYHYFGTVKQLAEHISEEDLNKMGITKAAELKGAAHAGTLTPEIVEKATDPKITVKDLRKILFDGNTPEQEKEKKGDWLDLEAAFYVNTDEKKLVLSAFKAALLAGDVKNDLKPWQRVKQVILLWSMEYLSAHAGVLEGESE